MNKIHLDFIKFVRKIYKSNSFIPLHEPKFIGNEKKYLIECINTNFVSSVGKFVDQIEKKICNYLGCKYAIATVNGTSALHVSLLLANVQRNDEVITQALTFVATANAIKYCGAEPIFIDVDKDSMGISPINLDSFLKKNTSIINKQCINNKTGKVIKACVPMHTFGHPCRIDEIKKICNKNYIFLIEDAAESLGSKFKGKYTGNFAKLSSISFNGNKIITSGGGGCIVTNDSILAKKAKHITTTAKTPHEWNYYHNQIGYNYRMPNLNAAILLAQLENLENFLRHKRLLAKKYNSFFKGSNIIFNNAPDNSESNYWLNSITLQNKKEKEIFLKFTNDNRVMTRPIWILLNKLPMFKYCQTDNLKNSQWLYDRVVCLPSSVSFE